MRVVNQITFTAKDDAEALKLAAERLGRDAVILSTQMIKEGGVFGLFQKSVLKVTAGILEDDTPRQPPKPKNQPPAATMDEDTRRETLIGFQRLMEFKERSSNNKNNPPEPSTNIGDEGYRIPGDDNVKISNEGLRNAYGLVTNKPLAAPVTPVQFQQQQLPQPATPQIQAQENLNPQPQNQNQNGISNEDARILKDQVGALADRLDFLLQRLTAVESGINANVRQNPNLNNASMFQAGIPTASSDESGIENRLRSSEVDEKYIRKLLADYSIQRRDGVQKNKKQSFTKWLATRIECASENGGDPIGGRKVMLIGPTGVGKTTTIAKLAAIKALWEHKKVLLLTSDTYRIAAVEQLKTYAKILGLPVEIVFEASNIPSIVANHDNADIILLDTAGRSQRDKKNMQVFESLYNYFTPDAVHLVLAANMKYKDMLDVVEHIPNIPVSHLLFTKLDETVSYGSIFNIQQVMGCPVSFLTVGQNVPKDIETASGAKIADFLMRTEEERKR